jgi:hypothetical protein
MEVVYHFISTLMSHRGSDDRTQTSGSHVQGTGRVQRPLALHFCQCSAYAADPVRIPEAIFHPQLVIHVALLGLHQEEDHGPAEEGIAD